MTLIATLLTYNPQTFPRNGKQGMTKNDGLTSSVGDTIPQFAISIEQDN
jgi:hypothetical protein